MSCMREERWPGGRESRVFVLLVIWSPTCDYILVSDTLSSTIVLTPHPGDHSIVPPPTHAAIHGIQPHTHHALTKAGKSALTKAASASTAKRPGVSPPAPPAQRVIARPEDLKQLSASGGGP